MYSQGEPQVIALSASPTSPLGAPRLLPKVICVADGICCGGLLVEPLASKNRVVLLLLTGYAALISRSIFCRPTLAFSTASTLLLPVLKTRTLISKML